MTSGSPSEFARQRFTGKKITLLGLGLLGRGLGDARFLAAAGANLIVTDLKTEAELAPSVAALRDVRTADGVPAHITLHLGGHQLADFENRDLIIKGNGTPLDSPFIARARERGIPVEMDAALFVKIWRESVASFDAMAPIIVGVTGTRGKSTTTQLIYEMARETFVVNTPQNQPKRNVFIGGNVRDVATLPLIDQVGPFDIIVLELDSWQLQGFAEDELSPHIAVWTNFMPDHMNYYHGDMERYFEDKAAIIRWQTAGDIFIAPSDIKERIEKTFFADAAGTGRKIPTTYIDPTTPENALPGEWDIALPGEHNRANAACAIAAARALGISDEVIKKVLKEFRGLPGRIELLGERDDVAYYNDSNSTTPDATIAALRALEENHRANAATTRPRAIVLIAGGSDKQLDFAPLAQEITALQVKKILKKLVLFNGAASEKLKALLPDETQKNLSLTMVATMADAVTAARSAAAPGDVILLSPSATSFGLFKNEYDRGEQFVKEFGYLQQ